MYVHTMLRTVQSYTSHSRSQGLFTVLVPRQPQDYASNALCHPTPYTYQHIPMCASTEIYIVVRVYQCSPTPCTMQYHDAVHVSVFTMLDHVVAAFIIMNSPVCAALPMLTAWSSQLRASSSNVSSEPAHVTTGE
jgi:hypothetical protein